MPGGWADSSRRSALPATWNTIRTAVLERDSYCCVWAERRQACGLPATDVDHIVPHSQGGTDDMTNLAALCAWHHKTKSSQEGNDARWQHSARRQAAPRHPGLL